MFKIFKPKKGQGALPNPYDPRNIKVREITRVTAVKPVPYKSDVSFLEINDQKQLGTCVAQAHSKVIEALQYKDLGQKDLLSAREHYALCKKKEGNTAQGTYPATSSDILKKHGITLNSDVFTDNSLSNEKFLSYTPTQDTDKIASNNKINGYAYVNPLNLQELLFAIKKYEYVPATIAFGNWVWSTGQAKPAKNNSQGLHRVVFYGYDFEVKTGRVIINYINSWGKSFGDKGCGWFYYDDYVANGVSQIYDVMPFTDIPQKVLDKKNVKMDKYLTEDADFYKAVQLVLEFEGGYTNDPNDDGGETNFGISKRAYPNEDIKGMTKEKAMMIYRRDYWIPMLCDKMPYPVALMVFDMGVNMGTKTALKALQKALGVTQDGIIGKVSLNALNKANPANLALKLGVQRIISYSKMTKFDIYSNTWVNRTLRCLLLK